MTWIVRAERPVVEGGVSVDWPYRDDYFPRKFRYKRDAVQCAETARAWGGRNVTVSREIKE